MKTMKAQMEDLIKKHKKEIEELKANQELQESQFADACDQYRHAIESNMQVFHQERQRFKGYKEAVADVLTIVHHNNRTITQTVKEVSAIEKPDLNLCGASSVPY